MTYGIPVWVHVALEGRGRIEIRYESLLYYREGGAGSFITNHFPLFIVIVRTIILVPCAALEVTKGYQIEIIVESLCIIQYLLQ